MANPTSEIDYNLAVKTRKDVIMATGRSDFPNQVNNVLGFPFIFRGALDVRATKINEEMKMAAVHALADLAKEHVPEQVNIAYHEKNIHFGRHYIIPKPFDARLIYKVPPAVAKAAMDSGVATRPISDWKAYEEELEERLGTGNKLMRQINNRAKAKPKKVIFAEAEHLSVLKAAQITFEEGIAKPILLGNKKTIKRLMKVISFEAKVPIIDPKSKSEEKRRNRYAEILWEQKQRKGITLLGAQRKMQELNYFAAMMVKTGDADAMVTGYSRSYPTVARPVMEVIGKEKGIKKIAATNLMLTKKGPLFLSDTAMNINPTAEDLVEIARMTYTTMKLFGLNPTLAMISFSNFGSAKSDSSDKIQKAVSYLHENYPKIIIDGELHVDFAINEKMRSEKFPFTKIEGKKVNGLIYPNLESANTSYKLMKELNKVDSVGPIIMGLNKAAHLLQLHASVDEIVNMVSVAVVDAQEKTKRKQPKK
jgi:malate dehydrogenase (oxaloacetate-decarboxylating)(NADP+)